MSDGVFGFAAAQGGMLVAESYDDDDSTYTSAIWSCTKSWASMLVGMVIEEGYLSLTSTLGEIWPDFALWSGVEDAVEKQQVCVWGGCGCGCGWARAKLAVFHSSAPSSMMRNLSFLDLT